MRREYGVGPRVSLVADGAQAGAWTQVRIHSHFSQSSVTQDLVQTGGREIGRTTYYSNTGVKVSSHLFLLS